jgi:hypothetical protein
VLDKILARYMPPGGGGRVWKAVAKAANRFGGFSGHLSGADVENASPPRQEKIFYTMSRKNHEYPCVAHVRYLWRIIKKQS